MSLRFDGSSLGAGTSIRIAVERRWDGDKDALKIPPSLKKSGGRSGLDAVFINRAIQSKCFAEISPEASVDPPAASNPWTLLLPGNVSVSSSGPGSLTVAASGLSVDRSFDGSKAVIVDAR